MDGFSSSKQSSTFSEEPVLMSTGDLLWEGNVTDRLPVTEEALT